MPRARHIRPASAPRLLAAQALAMLRRARCGHRAETIVAEIGLPRDVTARDAAAAARIVSRTLRPPWRLVSSELTSAIPDGAFGVAVRFIFSVHAA